MSNSNSSLSLENGASDVVDVDDSPRSASISPGVVKKEISNKRRLSDRESSPSNKRRKVTKVDDTVINEHFVSVNQKLKSLCAMNRELIQKVEVLEGVHVQMIHWKKKYLALKLSHILFDFYLIECSV